MLPEMQGSKREKDGNTKRIRETRRICLLQKVSNMITVLYESNPEFGDRREIKNIFCALSL